MHHAINTIVLKMFFTVRQYEPYKKHMSITSEHIPKSFCQI